MPPKKGGSRNTAASSSSTDWVAEVRARSLSNRYAMGEPGDERWQRFAERGSDYQALPGVQGHERTLGRQEHEMIRKDIAVHLSFFEPQADTMIIAGRPTQVPYCDIHKQ